MIIDLSCIPAQSLTTPIDPSKFQEDIIHSDRAVGWSLSRNTASLEGHRGATPGEEL